MDKTPKVFLELLKAGLWEKDARLSVFGEVDYGEVMRLAEEQSVLGLVTAGLERVKDANVPKEVILQFIGSTLQIEQRNKDMNMFVARLTENLRKESVYYLLVKGQGIAQCYERPLWRACGDVDLLLSNDTYEKAKNYLLPLASTVEPEAAKTRHLGMTIESWVVELHGTLHSGCFPKMDRVIDDVQRDVFYGGNVRSWINGKTTVFLPAPNNDVIFIFTHIIKHFFRGGIGLRQICDWCRLLWTYRDVMDVKLLEQRLRKARLVSEWKCFSALAVGWLGMPIEAIPLYEPANKWKRKANRVLEYIMRVGNFGHNRDLSYYSNRPYFMRKAISLGRRISDGLNHLLIFPIDSIRVWFRTIIGGLLAVIQKR